MKKLSDKIPFNIEAEQAVLGAILIADKNMNVIDDINLRVDDFYRPSHKIIYKAMLMLFKANKPIDNLTVIEYLNKTNELEKAGGIACITSLVNCVPSASNIKYYADMVKDTAIRRKYIQAGEQIKNIAYNAENIDSTVSKAEKLIFDISKENVYKGDIIEPTDLMIECMQEIEYQYEHNQNGVSGIDTGYIDLNKITGGFQNSDFIIIGARPAMGKTALALSMASKIAKKNIPVVVFSLEMSKAQLGKRLISGASCVNSQKISTGRLNENEWQRVIKATDILSKRPIYIEDSAEINILQLRSKARQLKVQEVSDISRQLKILAKELNIPVIALAQLSRSVEARQDKRPMLSDLRESGSIEQDADIVMFLYRDEYYNANTNNKNLAELIISKHRNGSTGKVNLYYHHDYCFFDDCIMDI